MCGPMRVCMSHGQYRNHGKRHFQLRIHQKAQKPFVGRVPRGYAEEGRPGACLDFRLNIDISDAFISIVNVHLSLTLITLLQQLNCAI